MAASLASICSALAQRFENRDGRLQGVRRHEVMVRAMPGQDVAEFWAQVSREIESRLRPGTKTLVWLTRPEIMTDPLRFYCRFHQQ